MKTVPIFLYWTRKSCINVSWKLFQQPRSRDSHNQSHILYNNATYLFLARLRNGNQVQQVIKLPISRVTADSSRQYIPYQAREGNLQEFFKHENNSSPLALSCNGKLRSGQKWELILCIELNTMLVHCRV